MIYLATPVTSIHLSRKAQSGSLISNKASTEIPTGYLDYADIFLPDLTIELLKHTKTNNHAIDLVEEKQPPYGSIYT